jgi:hypothetical protein
MAPAAATSTATAVHADAQAAHTAIGALWEICEFFMCTEPSGYTQSNYLHHTLQDMKQLNASSVKEHFIAAVTELKQLDSSGLLMSTPSKLGLGNTFWHLQHTWVSLQIPRGWPGIRGRQYRSLGAGRVSGVGCTDPSGLAGYQV